MNAAPRPSQDKRVGLPWAFRHLSRPRQLLFPLFFAFHASPDTSFNSVHEPRICNIENLKHDVIRSFGKFCGVLALHCNSAWTRKIPELANFVRKSGQIRSLASPGNTLCREPL